MSSDFTNKKCPRCGGRTWGNYHTCPPAFGVRCEGWHLEEEVEVLAVSPEEAAKKFIEDCFADLDHPQTSKVIVNDWRADHNAGRLYTFEITVELEPVFYAELIDEEPVTGDEEVEE